jgi:nucleoside-diphosphate-sugar epimerase
VRALARPTSDTTLLKKLGVELVTGDLTSPESAAALVAGADVVYHCAAKTSNWGAWSEYQVGNIQTTRRVVEACQNHREIRRLVHVSSIAVFGHPRVTGAKIADEAPLGQRLWLWDHYNRSKIAAEHAARQLGERATMIRPTCIYGPRDTSFIPRILRTLHRGGLWIIGSGDNQLNLVYATDAADAAIRAGHEPRAGGEAYNIASGGGLTQRELLDLLCTAEDLPPVRRRIPSRIAHAYGFLCEVAGHARRQPRPPAVTRHDLSVFTRPSHFASSKARAQLGWQPRIDAQEGVARTLHWLHQQAANHDVD